MYLSLHMLGSLVELRNPPPPPSRMQLTLHATRRTPHGPSRLVQAMSAWSVKTRRAPSRRCRGARVYGHMTTAMYDMSTPQPLLPAGAVHVRVLRSIDAACSCCCCWSQISLLPWSSPRPQKRHNNSMCVFFTLNRSFYPSTSSTPIILSVPILHPREVQALWSQTYDTEILHRNAAKGVDNAMSCHRAGYNRHNVRTPATQIHRMREKRKTT